MNATYFEWLLFVTMNANVFLVLKISWNNKENTKLQSDFSSCSVKYL